MAIIHRHSTHIEDFFILSGLSGIDSTLKTLESIKECFGSSDVNKQHSVSVKIDGSPAVITGWVGNKFFVASKGIFNVTPKINYSDEDIDANHSKAPGLAKKLKLALKYLKNVIPRGKIYQGDFLFDSSDRRSEVIDGKSCYVWHPNTIQYSVEQDSEIGKKIGKAKIGIVFHTQYVLPNVNDIKSLKLHDKEAFNVNISNFTASNDVWITDAFQKNAGSVPFLTKEEEIKFNNYASNVRTLKNNIPWNYLKEFGSSHVMPFMNTYVKAGKRYPVFSNTMVADYKKWLETNKKKEQDSKKTKSAKDKVDMEYKEVLKIPANMKYVFGVYKFITEMKLMLVAKYDKIQDIRTFLKTTNGDLVATGDEGYVITQNETKGCKLVDRLSFSRANFSPEFLKGWQHPHD